MEGERRAFIPNLNMHDYGFDEIRIHGNECLMEYLFMWKGEILLKNETYGLAYLRLGDKRWEKTTSLIDVFLKTYQHKHSSLYTTVKDNINEYGFDEIRITIKPRYKTSSASGDEWRIGHRYTFMKNGVILIKNDSEGISNLRVGEKKEGNKIFIKDMFKKIYDSNKFSELLIGKDNICDQLGCSNQSTITLKLKYLYDDSGEKTDPYINDKRPLIRKFCDRHSERGDCGYEDSDENYEIIHGNIIPPLKEDISKSHQIFL